METNYYRRGPSVSATPGEGASLSGGGGLPVQGVDRRSWWNVGWSKVRFVVAKDNALHERRMHRVRDRAKERMRCATDTAGIWRKAATAGDAGGEGTVGGGGWDNEWLGSSGSQYGWLVTGLGVARVFEMLSRQAAQRDDDETVGTRR
jgi:hypothetical protein